MPILNQTRTGKSVKDEIASLMKCIEKRGDSTMMMYIEVHCFTLAMVLDRLEYLENFYKNWKTFAGDVKRTLD